MLPLTGRPVCESRSPRHCFINVMWFVVCYVNIVLAGVPPTVGGAVHGGGAHQPLRIPRRTIEAFEVAAAQNTANNLETLGYLMGAEVDGCLTITMLLFLPQQLGTDCTCWSTGSDAILGAMNEERVMIGWIHTHPRHGLFMSSRDIHTQYASQKDQPLFVGIVTSYASSAVGETGIFRLTERGMSVVQQCKFDEKPRDDTSPGLHTHDGEDLFCPADNIQYTDGPIEVLDCRGVHDLESEGDPQPPPESASAATAQGRAEGQATGPAVQTSAPPAPASEATSQATGSAVQTTAIVPVEPEPAAAATAPDQVTEPTSRTTASALATAAIVAKKEPPTCQTG